MIVPGCSVVRGGGLYLHPVYKRFWEWSCDYTERRGVLIFSVLTAGIRRRGGGGRVQRSGGIDGTHGPLIGGGREGGGSSLAGGAPPPPVRVAWQRGRQLLEDPCPSGKCVRASRCDLNDRTVRVTSRHVALLWIWWDPSRYAGEPCAWITLSEEGPRGSRLHSCCLSSRKLQIYLELRNYFSRKTRLLDY